MSRSAQNLLLVLVGGAMLWITLGSGEYVNYVRPGFRYPLVAAAVALVGLGAAGLRREWRDTGDDPHDDDHGGHGPGVAWLLCLPVLAIFVIAPPALGSFTAARGAGRAAPPPPSPAEGFAPLPRTGAPVPMSMGEFIGRAYEAQTGDPASFEGVPVRLTGFVSPPAKGERGWRVTRLKVACCAGDAIPFPVIVRGLPRPPADTWVRVDGVWEPPAPGRRATVVQTLRGRSLQRVGRPSDPYE
ncbi:putative repeat protein (TIGR03943 family) [Actinomadura luteofluorescens]|uniref:Putative repeat protein (TIGR03943 family) n=1 Tax=Actinomadura luteofluorescens TaxID=46163 RepID=A0A7Y9JHG2_9ACTN|nr:TIGR03943 family protein [Actinomadura luteofluorescens]NYD48696.1 putative repeat protein (TIGR03943 family) [Actinomadura luteofluorescens]